MKISIPSIKHVHKRMNARKKTLKTDFVFGKVVPQEEQVFATKKRFPLTLHALVLVLNFPLPSKKSHDHMDRGCGDQPHYPERPEAHYSNSIVESHFCANLLTTTRVPYLSLQSVVL